MVSEHSVNEDHREDKVAITRTFKTEYKKNFRPFSQYEYSKGRFTERPTENKITDNIHSNNIIDHNNDSWYCEVVELRKKAGQYKVFILFIYNPKGLNLFEKLNYPYKNAGFLKFIGHILWFNYTLVMPIR